MTFFEPACANCGKAEKDHAEVWGSFPMFNSRPLRQCVSPDAWVPPTPEEPFSLVDLGSKERL